MPTSSSRICARGQIPLKLQHGFSQRTAASLGLMAAKDVDGFHVPPSITGDYARQLVDTLFDDSRLRSGCYRFSGRRHGISWKIRWRRSPPHLESSSRQPIVVGDVVVKLHRFPARVVSSDVKHQ